MNQYFNTKLQVYIIVCLMTTRVFGFDYCADKSCGQTGVHTMCKYPNEAVTCANMAVRTGLIEELNRTILDRHNFHRQTVALGKQPPQPAASNMMKLTWHDEAERIAQRWANQCQYGHDTCRNINNSWVGQNIASSVGHFIGVSSHDSYRSHFPNISETVQRFVDSFFDEVKDFDKTRVDKYSEVEGGKVVGHYTQMVWAETTGLGCGYEEMMSTNNYESTFQSFLVCNYIPGGNFLYQPLYKTGNACSECPETTKCSKTKSYPGLCTKDKKDFGETANDDDKMTSLGCETYYILIIYSVTVVVILVMN